MMSQPLSTLTRQSVLAALDLFEHLGRERFLEQFSFGEARGYFVRHPVSGVLCDSKAIVGVAYGLQHPAHGRLRAEDFSGGAATVVRLLRHLNFEVVGPSSDIHVDTNRDRRLWTTEEVEILVSEYLQMLTLELTGQAYNKSARRKALMPLLNGRSEGAIEFKHRNVSAIMMRMGLPRIRGYLPAENTEADMLTDAVARLLDVSPDLERAAEAAVNLPAVANAPDDFTGILAPAPMRRLRAHEPRPGYLRRPVKRDYLERETRNHTLGLAGEKFIVDYERWRLLKLGLGQLADQVQHASVTEGDGLGYDVLSFTPQGEKQFLEVKTTTFSEETPFFVTKNELEFARSQPERFKLCRVFDFRVGPRFFELSGPVENHFHLDPATYKATLG